MPITAAAVLEASQRLELEDLPPLDDRQIETIGLLLGGGEPKSCSLDLVYRGDNALDAASVEDTVTAHRGGGFTEPAVGRHQLALTLPVEILPGGARARLQDALAAAGPALDAIERHLDPTWSLVSAAVEEGDPNQA